MPGGRGPYIPIEVRDANLKKVRLFNPPVVRGRPPKDTDFSLTEWNGLVSEVYSSQKSRGGLRDHWLGLFGICVVFTVPGMIWGRSLMPVWLIPIVFTFPLWATVLMGLALKTAAENLWGVVAFSDVSEELVAEEMLVIGRCPSCAYRLPGVANGLRTCSECGATWRATASVSS